MADDSCGELTVGSKQLSSLRVIDLKTELEKRGLPKSGSKKELLERLKRQLQLENLQQKASQNEDQVPNLSLQDDEFASQNDLVKQYLAGQQRIYELQKEARRKIERDDAHRASDTEASSSQDEGCSVRDECRVQTPECIKSPPDTVREEEIKVDDIKTVVKEDTKEDIKRNVAEDVKKDKKEDVKKEDVKKDVEAETKEDVKKDITENVTKEDVNDVVRNIKEGVAEDEKEHIEHDEKDAVKVGSKQEIVEDLKEEIKETSESEDKHTSNERETAGEKTEDLPRTSTPAETIVVDANIIKADQSVNIVASHVKSGDEVEMATASILDKSDSRTDAPATYQEAKGDIPPDKVAELPLPADQTEPVVVQEAIDENRDELEMAVGSISIEREEIHDPLPIVTFVREERAEEATAESVVSDVVRTEVEVGTGGGSQDVIDETAEACRVITESYLEPAPTADDDDESSSSSSQGRESPLTTNKKSEVMKRKESSSDDEEEEGGRRRGEEDEGARKEEKRVPNGTDQADSNKDGHVLDLHPGDMDIGCPSTTSNEDARPEAGEKRETQNKTPIEQPAPQPRNISNRKLSLSGSRESKEPRDESRPQRKRRWGSLTSKSTPSISTESLKDLIPDYKPQLSSVPEDIVVPPIIIINNNNNNSSGALLGDVSADETSQEPPEKIATTEKEIVPKVEPSRPVHIDRRAVPSSAPISVPLPQRAVKEEPETKLAPSRSPSPAKNPTSRILFIRNLVRPFTLPQLKEVLARTGTFQTDAFWIDKIKSKCYVMYEMEDQAVATRAALHGSRWPVSNPKTLLVDFSTEDELNFHKQLGDSPGLPPVAASRGQGGNQKPDERFHSHRLDKNMTVVVSQNVPPQPASSSRSLDSRAHREGSDKKRTTSESRGRPVPIREWDRDKLSQEGSQPHHQRESASKQARGEPRPVSSDREKKERPSRKEKKEMLKKEEPPGKLLDDLFRKTKAVPCIYWLPLTETALAQREVDKKQWEADREKRREKRQEGDTSSERKPRPLREALKPLPPPMLTGGNVAPLKGRDFSRGRSRSPVRRR